MTIVVEVDADLFARMNSILTKNWRRSCCDPDTGQRVPIHLILLDQTFAFFMLKTIINMSMNKVKNIPHKHRHANHRVSYSAERSDRNRYESGYQQVHYRRCYYFR